MDFWQAIQKVFDAVEQYGGQAFFVGGCVRDSIILECDIDKFDIDIAVNLPVDVVSKAMGDIGAKTVVKYFTNITIFRGHVFEITSTRRDVECYGRDAKVEFTPSFEEDSFRRDFTINALYMGLDRAIYDYHNGLEDIKKRTVRFIGKAESRIREDYLRILRFFRFSAKYADEMVGENYEACLELQDGLLEISRERITAEFLKMMIYRNEEGFAGLVRTVSTLQALRRIRIFENIVPENLEFMRSDDRFLRFASVVLAQPSESSFLMTKAQKRVLKIYNSIESQMKERNGVIGLMYVIDRELLVSLLDLNNAICQELRHNLEEYESFLLPEIPLSKKEIFERFGDGLNCQNLFQEAVRLFVESGFCLTKEELFLRIAV